MTLGEKCKKWNVVYTKTVAGTVSQEMIDQKRAEVRDMTETHPNNYFEGIWNIELKPNSPDSEYAKFLMLTHETLEEEDLQMEIEECDPI